MRQFCANNLGDMRVLKAGLRSGLVLMGTLCFAHMALISTAHSQEGHLSVFSKTTKRPVATVPSDVVYTTVRREDSWHYVRFQSPSIPAWVSDKHLSKTANRATVVVEHLNMRLSPALGSPVLTLLKRGYASEILAAQNGFTQIYAPTDLVFALREDGLKDHANNASNAVQPKPSMATDAAPENKPSWLSLIHI